MFRTIILYFRIVTYSDIVWVIKKVDNQVMSNKAVFLDRDGTLNEDREDYVKTLAEFRLFDFTPKALTLFSKMNYKIILISNQSAIGRRLTNLETVDAIHAKIQALAERHNSHIDGIYICPHLPEENCDCRKPKTGNLEKAIQEHQIDPRRSFFIGDARKDIETGQAAGCRTIFVRTGIQSPSREIIDSWESKPDYIAGNIYEAAQLIECLERNGKV
jgi:histidinol-phosphate phosphatase family protein